MVFDGNESKDKSNQVVDAILQYISDHHLGVGDKLPPEEELTLLLGVSRVCVREGLRGLKFLGILKSSTSRGTVVQSMDFALLNRCMGFQIAIDDNSFLELLNARLVLELGVVDQLCGKLNDAQVAELESCLDCSRQGETPEEIARDVYLDSQFHQKLFLFCGNTILCNFARLLSIFFSRKLPKLGPKESQVAAHEHKLLVEALRSGNLELARGLMRMHIMKYEKYI